MTKQISSPASQGSRVGRVLGATAIAFSVLLGTLSVSQPAAGADLIDTADYQVTEASAPDLVLAGFKKKYHKKKKHGYRGFHGKKHFGHRGFGHKGFAKHHGHKHYGHKYHGHGGHSGFFYKKFFSLGGKYAYRY